MNWDQWIAQQDKLQAEIERQGDIFGIAVSTVHSDVGVRVFSKGISPQGDAIGQYSTKPTVISSDQSPKPLKDDTFQPLSASQRAKSGKKGYYGQFFEGGYKEFKKHVGRLEQGSNVNLRLFGNLQSDYINGLRKVNASTWVAETRNPANDKKLEGARDKYGDVFELSAAEAKKLQEVWDDELRKYLNRTQ